MPLVEVIRGAKSSDEAVSTVYQFSKKLGKTPIVVKDSPGFLVNRLLAPYLNEAARLLQDGATIEDIDGALLDFGMPMGPIELIDEVGVDVGEKVAHILHDAFGKRAEPSSANGKMVKAQRLGKKSSKGFYAYEGRDKKVETEIYSLLGVSPKPGSIAASEIVDRCILPMINEASRCLDESVVESPAEVDLGMIMGTGFPPFRGGLLRYADSLGASELVSRLKKYEARFGARFEPAPRLVSMAKSGAKFHED
jgi:3-hydroxyacyl-CoA dehydrogenase/enoyl-CoA hydratase/3-hydroxybutyryl-CoA epimerase